MRATKIRLENGEERDVLELEFVAQDEDAVTHKGESVIVDPKFMTMGVPQVFRFLDKYMVAVKAEDGNIDLYYFPDSDEDEEADDRRWIGLGNRPVLPGQRFQIQTDYTGQYGRHRSLHHKDCEGRAWLSLG